MAQSRMRRALCFDTAPLIWGVRGDASPGQEHMIERTKNFINYLSENKFSILVPSPVIAEYFVGATATEMHEAAILRRGFETPAFDARAAVLAAELQRGGMVDQIHDEFGHPKQAVRIDCFIIAIAVLEEAEKIITYNVKEFKKLSRGRIRVDEVPEIPQQGVLTFGD